MQFSFIPQICSFAVFLFSWTHVTQFEILLEPLDATYLPDPCFDRRTFRFDIVSINRWKWPGIFQSAIFCSGAKHAGAGKAKQCKAQDSYSQRNAESRYPFTTSRSPKGVVFTGFGQTGNSGSRHRLCSRWRVDQGRAYQGLQSSRLRKITRLYAGLG